MPDLTWNTRQWGGDYEWPEAGEEWSEPWGGSEAQWFGSLYPRLHRFLPAPKILEIAPGHGRWTRFLVPASSEYLGVDLNQSCVDVCKERFKADAHATFVTNDGVSLDAAEDGAFDFIFSFDSLVHAELDVFHGYVPEILRKLKADGVAFIHHSNMAAGHLRPGEHHHSRAGSVSADSVAEIIRANGGSVIIQETITWLDANLLDCLTTFGRADGAADSRAVRIDNPDFGAEALFIKRYQAPYCNLPTSSE